MRLGLLGGTFDPPHIGHLIAAQDALGCLTLDQVIFVPAAQPPHKQGRTVTPARIRLAMVSAAIGGDPRFLLDDIELRRGGPSYTVDTLRAYRLQHPAATLFLLIGADQYAELDSWREPAALRQLATVAVLSRAGWAPVSPPDITVPVTRIDITSTEVRRRVRDQLPVRYLIPDAVDGIIRREKLYVGHEAG